MNLKKRLFKFIVLTMILTGCSNYQVQNKEVSLPDDATKQKNMTKVQNDVNEIINKNYDYVLSNLGEPNITTYWIDKDNLDNIYTLEDIENLTNLDLIYLKKVSNEYTSNSALVLRLINGVVEKVQIVDYSEDSLIKNMDKSKIIVDFYTNGDVVEVKDLDIEGLDNYIGIDSDQISKIVGYKKPSYDAYLYDGVEKSLNVYYLDDKNKLLSIFISDNKVSEIKILDNSKEVVNDIKNIILDN